MLQRSTKLSSISNSIKAKERQKRKRESEKERKKRQRERKKANEEERESGRRENRQKEGVSEGRTGSCKERARERWQDCGHMNRGHDLTTMLKRRPCEHYLKTF